MYPQSESGSSANTVDTANESLRATRMEFQVLRFHKIYQLYDVGLNYLVMELVDGEPLNLKTAVVAYFTNWVTDSPTSPRWQSGDSAISVIR